jgi:hypothetical protein
MSTDEQQRFNAIAGQLLRELGYDAPVECAA